MKIKINKQLILEASSKKDFDNCPCDGVIRKLGFSCGKDSKGYFVYTHRSRSSSYKSLNDIPLSVLKNIDETG